MPNATTANCKASNTGRIRLDAANEVIQSGNDGGIRPARLDRGDAVVSPSVDRRIDINHIDGGQIVAVAGAANADDSKPRMTPN